jgi:hypothetical protein
MAELVKVEVLVEHGNSYGDTYLKKADTSYNVPLDMVPMLAGQGLIKPIEAVPAAKVTKA